MVELMIAISVILSAVFASITAMMSSAAVSQAARERMVATFAAQERLADLHAFPPAEVIAAFNDDDGDDALVVLGTVQGPHFPVAGIDVRKDDADGFEGEVLLPLNALGELREDANNLNFGLPRDLNGDGVVDALDHRADFIVLPARVRIQWTGKSGRRSLEMETLLSGL
jgi:hypothetical protein